MQYSEIKEQVDFQEILEKIPEFLKRLKTSIKELTKLFEESIYDDTNDELAEEQEFNESNAINCANMILEEIYAEIFEGLDSFQVDKKYPEIKKIIEPISAICFELKTCITKLHGVPWTYEECY